MYTRPFLVTYKDLSSERIGALGLAVGNEANQEREHALPWHIGFLSGYQGSVRRLQSLIKEIWPEGRLDTSVLIAADLCSIQTHR